MNGIDVAAIVIVVLLAAAWWRQHRIDRHDQTRDECRTAVKNILRATGKIR